MTDRVGRRRPPVRTRRRILDMMKRLGPSDAASLAARLRVSAMAVRQHLYMLMTDRCVTYREDPRPVGRPVKIWRLVASADRFFHDAHAELAVDLLQAAEGAFGRRGVNRLLSEREKLRSKSLRRKISENLSLESRVRALTTVRNREGYMAEVQNSADGAFLIVENHCPVRAAAEKYPRLCHAEVMGMRHVLGGGVHVDQVERLLDGDRRCAFRVADTDAESQSANHPPDAESKTETG